MARIVVAGYLVRYPLGGNAWAHFQYVLGLSRLGHQVWYLEEAGWDESCYDPLQDVETSDPTYGLGVLGKLAERFDLPQQFAYRDSHEEWHGLTASEVDDLIASADLFLDLGGTNDLPQAAHARRRAYVDMDPAFTQFQSFGAHWRLDQYDALFTVGANIGRASCPVPTLGFNWKPLRPPVVLDVWETPRQADPHANWTTVANWTAYGARQFEGETYGQKDIEFLRLIELPQRTSQPLELTLSGDDIPFEDLQAKGWRLGNAFRVADPWSYREYVCQSRGEFSVAKNAYVKTRCGWFSDRTASYLASGRPAVVQDTGVGDSLPTGCGLLTFRTMDEALTALECVASNYDAHCRAAREFAREYLDANRVLNGLLDQCDL